MRENTLFFKTFSFIRLVKNPGCYFTYWAYGKPRSIWNIRHQEIGCVYVDDIDYAEYEGEAELLLISLVERIPRPLDRDEPYRLRSSLDQWLASKSQPAKELPKKDKRRVGYFNVMWVVSDEQWPGAKRRVGTGVILTEFIVGQVDEEIASGMSDVFLY